MQVTLNIQGSYAVIEMHPDNFKDRATLEAMDEFQECGLLIFYDARPLSRRPDPKERPS